MITLSKRTIDETGNRYGHLLVMEYVGISKNRGHLALWKCLCDCGNESVVRGSRLRQGETKSCGCGQWSDYSSRTLPVGRASANALRLRYKQNAKRDGRVFAITEEEFVRITSSDCYYCRAEPSNVYGGKTYNGDYTYNGVDRVDNSKGYVISNVVPCCRDCNSKKQHLTIEEMRNFAVKMEAHARDYTIEN